MLKKPGRPLKYGSRIELLAKHSLYTAGSIARMALQQGYVEYASREYNNMRGSLARLSRCYGFPGEGDGHLRIVGQHSTPAWFGWRWRTILELRLAAHRTKGRKKPKKRRRRTQKKEK